MRISKREQILMVATITVALVALLYQFGFSRIYEAFSSTAGELASAEKTYNEYVSVLKTRDQIEAAYRDIEDQFPKAEKDKSPDKQFSEDIARLCSSLGFSYPKIQPPRDEQIEEVDDYKFITITVVTNEKLDNVAKLLKGFASRSLLIKELNLSSGLDSDLVTVTVTVARIAKVPESEVKAAAKERPARGRTPSTARPSSLF
jgi:hypothetical protein